jgi:ribonuclease HII
MKIYMDEAWRWPLFWPLHIGLTISFISSKQLQKHPLFKDSKALTPKKREIAFDEIYKLQSEKKLLTCIWSVDPNIIDTYWITRGINIAISRALYILLSQLLNQPIRKKTNYKKINTLIEKYEKEHEKIELIIDWKTDFWISKDLNIKTETIIHWDSECVEISISSILAKVSRDNLIDKIAQKYPDYYFEKHKGYWTKLHYEAIEKYGVLPEHRKLFLKKIFPNWKIHNFNTKNSF